MRKIISIAVCIAMLAAMTAFVSAYDGENYVVFSPSSNVDIPKNQHIAGDSNGDGKINMLDIITSLKYISGDTSSSLRDSIDTNSDGAVTTLDVLLIIRHVLNGGAGLGELVG